MFEYVDNQLKQLKRLLIVACGLAAIIGVWDGARAQTEADNVWNWAWREPDWELLAYTDDGEVNTVVEAGARHTSAWRISPDSAIAFITLVNGETAMYELTHEAIHPLTLNFDLAELEVPLGLDGRGYGYQLDSYHHPYMLFTHAMQQSSPPFDPLLLVNAEAMTVDLIGNDVLNFRLSEDGQRLRYVVGEGDFGAITLTIRERALASGEERDLHTISEETPTLVPDTYGERWLLGTIHDEGDDSMLIYQILEATGDAELIYSENVSFHYSYYEFFGEDLMFYQPICEANCSLNLMTPTGEVQTFSVPDALVGTHILTVVRRGDEDQIVISGGSDYWLLSSESEHALLGYAYFAGSHQPPMLSPDRRWLVTADSDPAVSTPTQYRAWDLVNQEMVLEFPVYEGNPLYMVYDSEGFITQLRDAGDEIFLYRYADEAAFDLPNAAGNSYFDILPGGDVLYMVFENQQYSIYRYNPDNGSSVLLVEDALTINMQDANDYAYPAL
jgi:hypothetical protein